MVFRLLIGFFWLAVIAGCNQQQEPEDQPGVASTNQIRLESGFFDPEKPTIVFFGGGNCVNSWEGTESWENEQTSGKEWFEKANVLSFHSYRMDTRSGDTTFYEAARLLIDTLLAMNPDYHQMVQTCGFSTGGTPALDLALAVNNPANDLPFRVTNVTLMDAPCYDYRSRLDSLNSFPESPLIVNLMGGLFNQHRKPYAGVVNADVVDGHDEVFWWYVNSLTTANGNVFNDGVTAGAYLSVIGDGRNIRISNNEDEVAYYINWSGEVSSGNYSLFDAEKYPEKLKHAYLSVTDPLGITDLGTALIHEHLLVDFIGADQTGYHRWERDQVVEKLLPLLEKVRAKGVQTIFDCTPVYLGRDPVLLRQLSEQSGLNIITNTGFYGAVQDKYLPAFTFDVSADSLAAIWVSEFENGIEGTGIRPGFIKISVDPDATLSEVDEKIVRAALMTHKKTGMTIVSHTGPDGPAFAQLRILEEENVSPVAWVWTHASQGTDEGRVRAAKMGAWISIDDVNEENIGEIVDRLSTLKQEDLLDRVLISHDAGWYDPDNPDNDQIRGYTDIFNFLKPALLQKGFTQNDLDQLLRINPSRAFRIQVRTN